LNAKPHPAAELEKTRAQALKELRGLLSEVLATAVASKDVPDAFRSVRNWERLIALTESRFADAWKQRFATGPQKPKQLGALELLADEEHDQAVLSEVFVNEVLEENKEPLDDLDKQLAAMSGIAPDPTRENPLGPHAWAAGIRSGVRELECSPDDRDWLMEQIMPVLADRVGQFYAAMSQQLTTAGYPGSGKRGRGGQAAKKVAAPAEPVAAATPTAGGFNPETVEYRQGGASGGGDAVEFDHLLSMLGAQRASDAGADGGDGSSAPSAPPGPAWTQDDILSVLSLMQKRQIGAPATADGASVAGNLRQAIGATASKMGLAGNVQSMPGEAQDTLALVSMLFEVLLDGKRLDERAVSELSRLVVPYVRVSMLDRQAFMLSTHPARRVLNLLVEAFETAAPDAKPYQPLRELGFQTIEKIVKEFADDMGLFEPLEEALAKEIEACRKRAELAEKRAAEAQNGRERREHARDTVANFLSKELFGKMIPTVLLDFLVGPWQHQHNLELLNEGDHSSEVMSNEQLLRDLLAASDNATALDAAQFVPRVADVLQSSGQPAESAGAFVQKLSDAFVASARVAKTPAPPSADAAPTESPIDAALKAAVPEWKPLKEVEEAAADAGPPAPVDLVAKYAEAAIGTWIDLVDAEGKITSVKFSWTSPISGNRILSNRRGQRVLVASPKELAAMELDGRIRPRQSATAVEQALHTITRKLESAASVAVAA
jgi:hypothetical protein